MEMMKRKSTSFAMIFLFLFSIISTSGCLEEEIDNTNTNDNSNNYNKLNTFYNNCKDDAFIIKIKGTKHFDYSDLPHLSKIGKPLKISGKASNKQLPLELNKVIIGFFDEYLKNDLKDWVQDLEKNYETIIKFK